MSFAIQFYKNSSPVNKVDKSIELVTTATGTLRDSSSILQPVILIETTYDAGQALITGSNYTYIEEFGRYYYITDVVAEINGLYEVKMDVDVLMTYSAQIKQQEAVIARQAFKRNMYLDDGWFMAYQNPDFKQLYFSNATPFESQEYVLIIAGS